MTESNLSLLYHAWFHYNGNINDELSTTKATVYSIIILDSIYESADSYSIYAERIPGYTWLRLRSFNTHDTNIMMSLI